MPFKKALLVLFFAAGFLAFLLFACAKKKPTELKKNNRPQLLVPANLSVAENQTVSFHLIAFDVDGTIPKLSALGLPKNSTFVDSVNGRGSFLWTPVFSQAGNYVFRFIVSDGVLADTERVAVSVGNVNRPPVWSPVSQRFFIEDSAGSFAVRALDPDGDSIFLLADSLPPGANFRDSLNGRGAFSWVPGFNQSGSYQPLFIATDRQLADSQRIMLQVRDSDRVPQFAPVPPQQTMEGELLAFGVSASDPDGDSVFLSADSLPIGTAFTDSLNGRGEFLWTPGFDQAGTYRPIIIATDRILTARLGVSIQVLNVIQALNFTPIGNQQISEGALLAFPLSAADPDNDSVFFSAESLPPGAVFTDSLNGRGSFSWTPDFQQAGLYRTLFIATDRVVADTQQVEIQVLDFDRPPLFALTPDQQVSEGQFLTFGVSATDPDGDPVRFSAMGLPAGAAFVDSLNGKGGFRWLTKVFQAGTYNVILFATSRSLADTEIISIRVDTALITYTSHVKPILDASCSCHYPGGIRCPVPGPCLNTYSNAFAFRDRIRIRVTSGTMPPGSPLPQGKRDTVSAWVLRGAPQ